MNYTEKDLVPYQSSPLPSGPWLVVAPHADDETFGMGGAILLACKAGIDVHVEIVTDGRVGGDGSNALVSRREEEARQACSMLGAVSCNFWREADRSVAVTRQLIDIMCGRISELNPSTIFFPSPFEYHPDHRAVAALVWQATQQCEFSGRTLAYEISTQGRAGILVDTTTVIGEKQKVMSLYGSQLTQNNYMDVVKSLDCARTYTLPQGVDAAEGFIEFQNSRGETLASQIKNLVSPYWRSIDA